MRGEINKGRSLPTKEEAEFVVEKVNLISQTLSELWTRQKRCYVCGDANITLKREHGEKAMRLYCEKHAK